MRGQRCRAAVPAKATGPGGLRHLAEAMGYLKGEAAAMVQCCAAVQVLLSTSDKGRGPASKDAAIYPPCCHASARRQALVSGGSELRPTPRVGGGLVFAPGVDFLFRPEEGPPDFGFVESPRAHMVVHQKSHDGREGDSARETLMREICFKLFYSRFSGY